MADALSQCNDETMAVSALSNMVPQWKLDMAATYEGDQVAADYIAEATVGQPTTTDVSVKDGVVMIKSHIYVGPSNLRLQLVHALHESSWSGHSGILPTYKHLSAVFYWPNQKENVKKIVTAYTICQTCKS